MPQLPLSGHVFSVGSCKFCCRLCWCYLWCHRCVWKNRNRLINSLQVKTFRALYDNPQWKNSILVTPQRIFLHQEYSSTITERLLTTPRWKNQAVFTQNTLESLLLRLCLSLRQHHWRRKKHHNTCKIFDPYAQTATSAKDGRYNIWRHNG